MAVFDIDIYSGMYEVDLEKQQESALMAFVLYNISDEIVSEEKAQELPTRKADNRVCILFQEKWSHNFTEKDKSNLSGDTSRRYMNSWESMFPWESEAGSGNLKNCVTSHNAGSRDTSCIVIFWEADILIDMRRTAFRYRKAGSGTVTVTDSKML